MSDIDALRAKAAADAMHRLKHKVLPELDLVIAGTPTGPVRDNLTTLNTLLHAIAKGHPIPIEAASPAS